MAERDRIILGVDPGTNLLGFGIVRVCGRNVEFVSMGVVDLRKESDHFVKLRRITREMGEIIDRYAPDDMAVESPFYGKNAQVILKLGRAQGAAISAALMRDIPVFEYAPRKVKMAITGNGSATKEQLSLMLEKTLRIKLDTPFLDATDALGIAMCHYYQLTNPLADTSASSSWEKFVLNNPSRIKK